MLVLTEICSDTAGTGWEPGVEGVTQPQEGQGSRAWLSSAT